VSTHELFPTDGANVQIRPQVHIFERLSVLGLIRHSFALCRKGVSVALKGMDVVYKLLFASSTKRYGTIWCIQNRWYSWRWGLVSCLLFLVICYFLLLVGACFLWSLLRCFLYMGIYCSLDIFCQGFYVLLVTLPPL
jgi:hypothetical protein